MTMKKRTVTQSFLLALLGICLLAGVRSFGQDTNASLSGTVTDQSNAAIPGAKLVLTNIATGFQSNFVSDETGGFSFRNLTPGKYKPFDNCCGLQVGHAGGY